MLAFQTHQQWVIAVSAVLGTAICLKALDLAGRVRWRQCIGPRPLATTAVVFGAATWILDQVLIQAFPSQLAEAPGDLGLVLLSLVLAMGVTGSSFFAMNRSAGGARVLGLGGAFYGLGIVAMHTTASSAREGFPAVALNPVWLVAALLVAVGGGTIALWLTFRNAGVHSKIAAVLMVGLTLSGLHYTTLQGTGGPVSSASPPEAFDATQLALGFVVAAFLILFLASLSAMLDRRFAVLAEREAETVRRSEERFRYRYSMTPLPLHALTAEGRIDHVSDAWLELLGYRRDEVIGQPLVAFMTPDSAQRRALDWDRLIQDGFLREVEYRMKTRSGEVLDVVLSSRAERDPAGRFLGALGGLVDITARRRAEAALRQSQKIEAIGQLTGGVAHDFNNLLAVVLGNLEMLRKRLPEDARMKRQLDSAAQAAKRGASLTERMLSFARRQDLKPESVDLRRLVHEMKDLLRNAVGSEITIDLRVPPDLPPARVDVNQLELSLINLAVNARDAMGVGGMLTIGARSQRLASGEVEGLKAGHYLCLFVADTGSGMDEVTLARAREPFFTTKGVGKGTGLGLSMVHGLAQQSGGVLVLMSRLGQGTTAEIWLPLAESASSCALLAPSPTEPPLLDPLRILVVDDDRLVLDSTVELLEDLGHIVVSASSGREGLDLFRREGRFDLVMTDQAMPQMTGVQFATLLREEAPGQPIVLASGYAEIPEGTSLDLPRLRKPFDQAALSRVVAEAVPGKSRSRQVLPFRQKHTG